MELFFKAKFVLSFICVKGMSARISKGESLAPKFPSDNPTWQFMSVVMLSMYSRLVGVSTLPEISSAMVCSGTSNIFNAYNTLLAKCLDFNKEASMMYV